MSPEVISIPWQSVLQELALMRTRVDWANSLEYLSGQLAEAERCLFLVSTGPGDWWRPSTDDQTLTASESSLVGSAWSNSEVVHSHGGSGDLVTGWPAMPPCWALPIRGFGKVIGILTLEKVQHPPHVEAWSSMLELVAHSWDNVCRAEDHNRYQQQTEALLVKALESLPSYRPGHVQRVAHMSSELGRLLDLSAHQRQRLHRAGMYHDVGLLVSAVDHARAGAEFLRSGRVHADLADLVENHHRRYDPQSRLGLEEWTLALVEHFQEFCEAQTQPESGDRLVQRFALQFGSQHHPAVVDALIGLSVSGKLDALLLPPTPVVDGA